MSVNQHLVLLAPFCDVRPSPGFDRNWSRYPGARWHCTRGIITEKNPD